MKVYTVKVERHGRPARFVTGTVSQIGSHFGQVRSTIKATMNAIWKEYERREACIYNRTAITLTEGTVHES